MHFDGKIGGIQGDLMIPYHGTLSFDISGHGAGVPADKAGMIDMLAHGGPWVFDDAAKAYRLKATIEVPETKPADDGPNRHWRGRIEIPAVAVPLKPEPLDPAKKASEDRAATTSNRDAAAKSPPDNLAREGWSEAVNGLQARLVLKRNEVFNGTPIISTYLELRNVSDLGKPMAPFDGNVEQEFEVIDADGRTALPPPGPNAYFGYIGGLHTDLVIPYHGTLSFDISSHGAGVPANMAGMIDVGLFSTWFFEDTDEVYRLKSTIEDPETKPADDGPNWQWHGRIEIPAVVVPLQPEPANPAKLGDTIERLGKEMLGGDSAKRQKAIPELSLIHDPRVIPWYLKAIDTDRSDLKLVALQRLAGFRADAALEGLKKGMKTQGRDIGNCTTPEAAAQAADRIRRAAACALARSPHPEAEKLLWSMCDDPCPAVRMAVLHPDTALHWDTFIDSVESLTLVRKMTKDPDKAVRDQAMQCLRYASIVQVIQLVDKKDVPPGPDAGVPFLNISHPKEKLPKPLSLGPVLNGRLSGVYPVKGTLEVADFLIEGKTITARLRFIDEDKAEIVSNVSGDKSEKPVYFWGCMPGYLLPGEYTVNVELDEYVRQGDKLVLAPPSDSRHRERLSCAYTVLSKASADRAGATPNLDDAKSPDKAAGSGMVRRRQRPAGEARFEADRSRQRHAHHLDLPGTPQRIRHCRTDRPAVGQRPQGIQGHRRRRARLSAGALIYRGGGPVVDAKVWVIPQHGTLSFDISGLGAAVSADKAGMIVVLGSWEFDDAAKGYRLKGTIEVPKPKPGDKDPNDPDRQWHGRIDSPRSRSRSSPNRQTRRNWARRSSDWEKRCSTATRQSGKRQ